MAYKPLFGSKPREQVWQLECLAAHVAGRGELPICVHCEQPVGPGQAWDRAHVTVPRAFGGKSVGVGHRKCNQLDNNQVVFAFGETLAHLHCLETRARVKRTVVDGVHRFVALVDSAQPPADDSDSDVMDIGTA